MPRRRAGHTTAVTIGGECLHLTTNNRGDGSLGEVLLRWGKQGQTQAGLTDIYAAALSLGLQRGVPLEGLVLQGLNLYFAPHGHTDDPDLPRVRSVVDWVARRLALDWLPYPTRAAMGIFSVDERVEHAGGWLAAEAAKLPAAQAGASSADPAAAPDEMMAAFQENLAAGWGAAVRPRY